MLEFYYDFIDKYIDRKDFELIQMDTDSLYMALSSEKMDDILKPCDISEFLSTSKYHDRTPGLFKAEFTGNKMIALTNKCYYAENSELKSKFSCKGINKRQNEMSWERYYEALHGFKDVVTNTGFRMNDNKIVTYSQNKLGLSANFDKRIVHEDGIHTENLY